jgi:Protein of unknown function (DUF3025)
VAAGAAVAAALDRAASGITLDAGPLRFVPQARLPAGVAFEAYVHASASVPTREHLHDFFSGLVWLRKPALKRQLNQCQAAELVRHGVGPTRGAVRDALTRFDESGALLDAPPALWAALGRRDWPTLFVSRRADWQQARLLIVGHALLEQLTIAPRKALTAFVWAAAGDPASAPAPAWAGRPFLPLPVLGVPGWWPANEAPGFYDDSTVFRPAKALSGAGVVPARGLKPRAKP